MPRHSKPKLTPDEKVDLVLDILRDKTTVEDTAKTLNLPVETVEDWHDAFLRAGRNALDPKRQAMQIEIFDRAMGYLQFALNMIELAAVSNGPSSLRVRTYADADEPIKPESDNS